MSLNLPDMDIVPECSTEVAGLAFAVSGGDIRSLHASEFFVSAIVRNRARPNPKDQSSSVQVTKFIMMSNGAMQQSF